MHSIATWGQLVDAIKSAPRESYITSWQWRDRWRPERIELRLVSSPDGGRYMPSISQARLRAAGIDRSTPVMWSPNRAVVAWQTPHRRGALSFLALTELPANARHP